MRSTALPFIFLLWIRAEAFNSIHQSRSILSRPCKVSVSLSGSFLRPLEGRHSSFLSAKPKQGKIIDSYQTVSVNCAKCGERLFRYKKKNGTKSNLVKCFVERISEDCVGILQDKVESADTYVCPSCKTAFARGTMIRGLPALKMMGGKIRMTKK